MDFTWTFQTTTKYNNINHVYKTSDVTCESNILFVKNWFLNKNILTIDHSHSADPHVFARNGKRIFFGCKHTVAVWTEKQFIPLLTCPQGSQGCQKMCQDPLNMPVEVWCAKIAPKLKNIWKGLRKQNFFDIFFFNFEDLWSLCLFGAILAQNLNSFIC